MANPLEFLESLKNAASQHQYNPNQGGPVSQFMPGQATPQQSVSQFQAPPQSKEEMMAREKTKAIGSLVNDFSKSLGDMPLEMSKPLINAFLKNFISPKEQQKPQETPLNPLIGGSTGVEKPQQPTQPVTKTETAAPQGPQKPNHLMQALRHMGVPALAAILGGTGAMPLASAAGLGSGYAEGFAGAQKRTATETEEKADRDSKDWKTALDIAGKMKTKDENGDDVPVSKEELGPLAKEIYALIKKREGAIAAQKTIVETGGNGGLTKPENVPQKNWDAATEKQRQDLLKALGR